MLWFIQFFSFCLPYCGSNIINHFFCDLLPVFSLACADTQVNKFLLFIVAGAGGVLTSVIILVSCSYIIMAILRIHSAYGRWKVFSTCSSHLAVSILCGTLFFTYVWPSSSFSLDINKVVSVFYTAVTPILNHSSLAWETRKSKIHSEDHVKGISSLWVNKLEYHFTTDWALTCMQDATAWPVYRKS